MLVLVLVAGRAAVSCPSRPLGPAPFFGGSGSCAPVRWPSRPRGCRFPCVLGVVFLSARVLGVPASRPALARSSGLTSARWPCACPVLCPAWPLSLVLCPHGGSPRLSAPPPASRLRAGLCRRLRGGPGRRRLASRGPARRSGARTAPQAPAPAPSGPGPRPRPPPTGPALGSCPRALRWFPRPCVGVELPSPSRLVSAPGARPLACARAGPWPRPRLRVRAGCRAVVLRGVRGAGCGVRGAVCGCGFVVFGVGRAGGVVPGVRGGLVCCVTPRCLAPFRLASPRPASPRSASPRPASPRSASPRPASPRSASPRLASPRSALPRLAPFRAPGSGLGREAGLRAGCGCGCRSGRVRGVVRCRGCGRVPGPGVGVRGGGWW